MDLRQRIEDGAGRLPHELQRAAHVEGAVERLFCAIEAAEADANLPERGERHAQAVRRAALLLQLHAALGQRQRLVVPVLHQRDVRLVAADGRQHVPGLDEHRQTLRLAERRHRFVEAAFLGKRDARERMHHRQVAPVADGVQGRGRLRQVLADNGRVADLPIAQAQFEVREADGSRVVRAFGGLTRFGEEGDAARRLAARRRETAVHPPEIGKAGRVESLPRLGRTPQGLGRLADVVLQQPGLGQRAADLNLLLAPQPGPLQHPNEQGRRVCAAALVERPNGLAIEVLSRHGGDSIPRIQGNRARSPRFAGARFASLGSGLAFQHWLSRGLTRMLKCKT